MPRRVARGRCSVGTRRFYHVFAKGELEELLEQAGGLDLVRTGYDRDNWYAVGRKRPSR